VLERYGGFVKIQSKDRALKRNLRQIKKAMGLEGVKIYKLLLELTDERGQIQFEGSEEDMLKEIQRLYAARYGGHVDG
jgi:DNA polymerase III delta prime subunit